MSLTPGLQNTSLSAQGCVMCCCGQSVGPERSVHVVAASAAAHASAAAPSGARRAGRRGHLRAARAGALVAGRVRPRLPLAPAVPPVRGGGRRGALPRRARAARLARRQRRVPVARAARCAGSRRGRRPLAARPPRLAIRVPRLRICACLRCRQQARPQPGTVPAGGYIRLDVPTRERWRVAVTARVFRL